MTDADGGGRVSYNVKDLLAEINTKLDRFLEKLETKAERSDVHELKGRVAALEKGAEITRVLESNRETTRERGLTRFQGYIVIVSGVASTVAIALSLIPHRHF